MKICENLRCRRHLRYLRAIYQLLKKQSYVKNLGYDSDFRKLVSVLKTYHRI
jgi:hypothetical protein